MPKKEEAGGFRFFFLFTKILYFLPVGWLRLLSLALQDLPDRRVQQNILHLFHLISNSLVLVEAMLYFYHDYYVHENGPLPKTPFESSLWETSAPFLPFTIRKGSMNGKKSLQSGVSIVKTAGAIRHFKFTLVRNLLHTC